MNNYMKNIKKIFMEKLLLDFIQNYGIIIMKDEKVWDYSYCQIGSPCK